MHTNEGLRVKRKLMCGINSKFYSSGCEIFPTKSRSYERLFVALHLLLKEIIESPAVVLSLRGVSNSASWRVTE